MDASTPFDAVDAADERDGFYVFDLTVPISTAMATWPGDPPVAVERLPAGEGEPAVSALHLGTHTGTHVDPPAHLLPGGATVDELDLATLVGPAHVADVRRPARAAGAIDPDELAGLGLPAGVRRLLLASGGERTLSPAGAGALVAAGVRLVGVDGPSVDAASAASLPVHRILLGAGVVIVEGLDLAGVADGPGLLVCLPLRIAGGDGAPARVVLLRPAPAR